MQFLPQQQPYGALPGQCQQCSLSPYGGLNPQQYYNNPYQQQQYYSNPYQQQQFYGNPYQQQQFYGNPYQQQQQYFNNPYQQQQQFPFFPQAQSLFYPQQQQQQYPFYPQQQWSNWPQGAFGQNVAGYQQFQPQQQRVFEDPSSRSQQPRHEKEKPKKVYERYYH